MGKTFVNPPAPLWAGCAFLVASSLATARADERAAPNIPDPERKSDAGLAASASELPLPYESWRGTGHPPPPAAVAHDTPLPFARSPELSRRPFELSASLTALLPSCGTGGIDDRGCVTVRAGAALDAALAYRVSPFFAVGLEALASGVGGDDAGALGGRGGSARFGGIVGRLYFADSGVWDPYVALTLAVGTLTLPGRAETKPRVATSGLGGRIAGGIDYLLGSHFRVGPAASFAHCVAWTERQCTDGVCRDQTSAHGRLLGFATLGVRLTGSFGVNL